MPLKSSDLAAIVRGLAPIVRELIVGAVGSLTERVRTLEERPAPIGPIGPPGPAGRDGLDGRDGQPGRDGEPGRPGHDGISGRDGVDGKDGAHGLDGTNGRDGVDGLGFDDLDVIEEDGRQLLRFQRGERIKTFRLHTLSDRGIYKSRTAYLRGDAVTWDGALWIAQRDTSARPGEDNEASRAWRLAVKRGRDGRDGEKGDTGDRGPAGLPGGRL